MANGEKIYVSVVVGFSIASLKPEEGEDYVKGGSGLLITASNKL